MTPTPNRDEEKLYFEKIKEGRGKYFVEYQPPPPHHRFAMLNVVFPHRTEIGEIAEIMEAEAQAWISRYQIPIMVSSFDETEDVQHLSPVRSCDHLIAFRDKSQGTVRLLWGLAPEQEIPDDALNTNWLKQVYSDIPMKTSAQVREEANAHAKRVRNGWLIVVAWATILPAAWAIVEWAGPRWLETIVMLYGVGKAFIEALKLTGRWKKSPRDLVNEEEDRRMRHYFYHCERNPEGFVRLKSENFDREMMDAVRNEAAVLNSNIPRQD